MEAKKGRIWPKKYVLFFFLVPVWLFPPDAFQLLQGCTRGSPESEMKTLLLYSYTPFSANASHRQKKQHPNHEHDSIRLSD